MPVYRAGTSKWRVRIWKAGRRRDWIVSGKKSDAEAFEARKRLELEASDPGELRVAPGFLTFSAVSYTPHAKAHLRASTWSTRRYHLVTLLGDHLKTGQL
jgi:hypothetical protein